MPRPEKTDLSTLSGRIGAEIRKRRKRRKLSRDDLAARVTEVARDAGSDYEMTEMALRGYENGNRPIPLNVLPFIASALEVSVRTLIPRGD